MWVWSGWLVALGLGWVLFAYEWRVASQALALAEKWSQRAKAYKARMEQLEDAWPQGEDLPERGRGPWIVGPPSIPPPPPDPPHIRAPQPWPLAPEPSPPPGVDRLMEALTEVTDLARLWGPDHPHVVQYVETAKDIPDFTMLSAGVRAVMRDSDDD